MIIRSSTIETDQAGDAQDSYDTKVSQLSPLNLKTKSEWHMYLGLTMRYTRVTTDIGFCCMIDTSDTVVQGREFGYPNTFNLYRRH